MRLSTDRILTTHAGSLPRPEALVPLLFAKDRGEDYDASEFDARIRDSVAEVVRAQVEAGLDSVSDGEMSKITYTTYITQRLSGFAGAQSRRIPKDLEEYPEYLDQCVRAGIAPVVRRPSCVGEVRLEDPEPLRKDVANLAAAVAQSKPAEAFMTAPSPGVAALFMLNEYYPSEEAYLEALADVLREEYEAIHQAGFTLQIDCPDLAFGRHIVFSDDSPAAFRKVATRNVEALNHATANIPPESMRMHVCWGNYPGPHHLDTPLRDIIDIVLRARPAAISIEAANPRHEHEWAVFKDIALPDDKILIPGVIDSTSNFVEHPELVAQRLCRYAEVVGKERVIAGADCGFSTAAGFPAVHPSIVWPKFRALVEGARLASETLW